MCRKLASTDFLKSKLLRCLRSRELCSTCNNQVTGLPKTIFFFTRVFAILFFRVCFVFFLSKKEERRNERQHGNSTVMPFQEKDVSGVF